MILPDLKPQQLHVEDVGFCTKSLDFRDSDVTNLLIDVATDAKMNLINQDDFSMKFRIIIMHLKDPISKDTALLMID